MKSKDLEKVVFSRRQDGDGPTIIFRDLSRELCLETIKRECKMIEQTSSINIGHPAGCSSIMRTPSTIDQVKNRMKRRGRVSARRLSKNRNISRTSIQRILKDDLGYFPYKIISKSFLTDAHKTERK